MSCFLNSKCTNPPFFIQIPPAPLFQRGIPSKVDCYPKSACLNTVRFKKLTLNPSQKGEACPSAIKNVIRHYLFPITYLNYIFFLYFNLLRNQV